jgi:3-methyladenine DNA glycosylase AlkD
MPTIRAVAKKYAELTLPEIEKVLESPIHEHRMAGLVIMVNKARSKRLSELELKEVYDFYLDKTDRINNWDLIDISCRDIVGRYLFDKSRKPLYDLAKSEDLWDRRISIVSTAYFIGKNDFTDTWKISEILLYDKHDLIHKAVGWMLREAGKRDEVQLKNFLDKHAHIMPRTMLRYSLEKLNQVDKQHYMNQ